MKNSKLSLKSLVLAIFFGFIVFLTACSDENSIISSFDREVTPSKLPPASITIEPFWENGFLMFRVKNNSQDTIINDFHVQFDSSVKIIGWGVTAGWQIDGATTDTGKGKIGVKAGLQGQPIPPMGGIGIPLGVRLKFTGVTKKDPRHWWDFTWQATRDGIVVRSGMDAFPER